ncbi:hypothetical protein ACHAWT_001871 [Skeletonema menzelii]
MEMRAKRVALCFITLLLAFDLLLAFSSVSESKRQSFFRTVTSWLDEEHIAWQQLTERVFPRDITIRNPILTVATPSTLYYLHILQSPTRMSHCLSPTCTRDMTNYVQYLNAQRQVNEQSTQGSNNSTKISIIHLHEDVWYSKSEIVQCRLRTRLGGGTNNKTNSSYRRIYARKTNAKRIDAGTAIPFLQKHHLWSATKARYYYGLFLPCKGKSGVKEDDGDDELLVAVATFSTKRKIIRGTRVTRSHELIRFCSTADGVVIGGITKLIRTFVKEQEPVDDIVTVVDRDWGPGDGWHAIGFETIHVSAPLFMVVKDGIRRHLVGAGITNQSPASKKSSNEISTGRPGIDEHVLEELASLDTHEEALHCLGQNDYYPVYDAGVERLVMTLNTQSSEATSKETMVQDCAPQADFVPATYAATYRTNNSGISAILGHIMAHTASSLYGRYLSEILSGKAIVNDSDKAKSDANAWKATGGDGKSEVLVYKAQSSLDPHAMVEVKERPGGWCTLGIVGGTTKSIHHGNFKMVDTEGCRYIDSSVMVYEYLRSMATMALVGLEYRRAHPDDDSANANLSCLYLGYGAGSLPRFMTNLIPNSKHVAIELDEGVVSAAHQCRLLEHSLSSDGEPIELLVGDALKYRRSAHSDPFDIVFVDIFDDENILPPEFYCTEFLSDVVDQNHLGGRPDGIVVHNFHTSGKSRSSQLADAIKNYRRIFSTVLTVESIDSRHTGGNTILLASNNRRLDASSETLSWRLAGMMTQQCSGVNFDVVARSNHKLWLS